MKKLHELPEGTKVGVWVYNGEVYIEATIKFHQYPSWTVVTSNETGEDYKILPNQPFELLT